jgi:hypothetical protein
MPTHLHGTAPSGTPNTINEKDTCNERGGKAAARLAGIDQLVDYHPGISTATVRAWIHRAEHYGLQHCLIKIGRRVYIDLDAFDTWLEKHRMGRRAA